MTFPRSRILLALLVMTLTGALVAPAASQADAGSGTSAAAAKKRKVAPRHGGKVRKAWPAKKSRGNRPNKKLAQFLAKQVGPTVLPKKRKAKSARSARGPPSTGPLLTSSPAPPHKALRLVRSFDIPADDPAAARMANLSWTYDSAVAAVALINAGEKTQAEQLLDQLAALQRTDGSIDYAFDVSNGASLQLFNTGAIAWAGVAAAMYRTTSTARTATALAGGTTKWLLNRSWRAACSPPARPTWASTQHNIIAWYLLMLCRPTACLLGRQRSPSQRARRLGDRDQARPAGHRRRDQMGLQPGRRRRDAPARRPALGVLFLCLRRRARAQPQAGTSDVQGPQPPPYTAYPVGDRTIAKSSAPARAITRPTRRPAPHGYRPYAPGGPDILSAEASAQVRFMPRCWAFSAAPLDKRDLTPGTWSRS